MIEKINEHNAEIIFSVGGLTPSGGGFLKENSYSYISTAVLPGPLIEWINDSKPAPNAPGNLHCPCKLTLEMTKDKNTLIAYWEFIAQKIKWRTDLKRSIPAAVHNKSENIFDVLESGEWGWIEGDYNCDNNPHMINFSHDRTRATFTFKKSFDSADGTFTNISNYTVTKIKGNRITMSVVGEQRKDNDGNPVIWELIIENKNTYSWRRLDWPSDNRTPKIERCKKI